MSKNISYIYPNRILQREHKIYPKAPIPLKSKNTFTLLISVLLSAQCTDKRVNQVTPYLFKKASNPAEMIQLKVEEIQEVIRPCGLSGSKSKAIHSLSKDLLEKHEGSRSSKGVPLEKSRL